MSTIMERMISFIEAIRPDLLKQVIRLNNDYHSGNLLEMVNNIQHGLRTITCWSSLSGLSWMWGMSAMEAAAHCNMLLS